MARAPRRPWWWWLARLAGAVWVASTIWILYRAFAGYPILGGLLARLGG